MSFLDSLLISVFGLAIVFLVLMSLAAVVFLMSKLFNSFSQKRKIDVTVNAPSQASLAVSEASIDAGYSIGELKLLNVDDRTAAMVMAIVSDESGITLSELQFKRIKAMD